MLLGHTGAMPVWPRNYVPAVFLLMAAACTGCGVTSRSPAGSPTLTQPALTESSRVTFYAADPGDRAGTIVTGDFNGDSAPDLLFAAAAAAGPQNTRPEAGEAYIFLGPFSPGTRLDASLLEYDVIIYGARAGDQLGRAAAAADFNGDGIDDIAIAAPFATPDGARPGAGVVNFLFGSSALGRDVRRIDLRSAPAGSMVLGADTGDSAGFNLFADDLNGDSADDLIIGAFLADGPDNAREDAGEVYVIRGGSIPSRLDLAAGAQDTTIYGAVAGDRLGEFVATGDIDGDGRGDLIASAPFAAGSRDDREAAGEAYIILSPPPKRLDLAHEPADVTVVGVDAGDQIGHSLASGDVNGDGFDDLWLGSVSADGPDNEADLAGEAHLVLGAETPPKRADTAAGEAAALIYGAMAKARLGRSASAADLNGDGLADLIIAAPNVDARRGAIHLIYGRRSSSYPQTTAKADLTLVGLDPGDFLGHEALGTPPLGTADVDGDGHRELLAGAPLGDGPNNDRPDAGEAYIIFLRRQP